MYCHTHHCHYHQCNCVPKDSKETGRALTQEELLAYTQEMKEELKDYTVDLKDQIFSYIDIGLNPVEIANSINSLKEQDTYILRTLTQKIDELNNTTNLSMYNLRTRVTNLESNLSSLPFEGGVLAATFVTVEEQFLGQGAMSLRDFNSRVELTVNDIASLIKLKPVNGRTAYVRGYFGSYGVGDGKYIYLTDVARNKHNGGTVISPTVPAPILTVASRDSYLNAAGDTNATGFGCWVRLSDSAVDISVFGADSRLSDNSLCLIKACGSGIKHITIKNNITFKDEQVVELTNNCEISITGNLKVSGEVTLSFHPEGLTFNANGFDLTINGGGSIDWLDADTTTIFKRRMLYINNARKSVVSNLSTTAARFLAQGEYIEFNRIHIRTRLGTMHNTNASGFLKGAATYKGIIEKCTIIAHCIDDPEFIKINAGQNFTIEGNYLESTNPIGYGQIDVFSGGRNCSIKGNTFKNISIETKNSYPTVEDNNCVDISDNKFHITQGIMSFFIYRRSGLVNVHNNFFSSDIDSESLRAIIYFDKEADSPEARANQQGFVVDSNVVDMRKVTKDDTGFVFITTDLIVGSDEDSLSNTCSNNIVLGMTGLVRGRMFMGGTINNCILDCTNKTQVSVGNFNAKSINNCTIIGWEGSPIITQAYTVTNSPKLAESTDTSKAVILVSADGVFNTKGRKAISLTASNMASQRISSIIEYSAEPIYMTNETDSPITYNLFSGYTAGTIPVGATCMFLPMHVRITDTVSAYRMRVFRMPDNRGFEELHTPAIP